MKQVAILLLICLLIANARGEAVQEDLVDVPTDRMIANLEKRGSKDAHALYLLGRVHSLAYAQGLSAVRVRKGEQEPYFGRFDQGVPPAPPAPDAAAKRRQHLSKAIAAYRQAVKLDPGNLSARLGLSWCLQQSGDKPAALAGYRETFKLAYPAQMKKEGPLFTTSLAEETGRYLLSLLDPKKDAAEIAELNQKMQALQRLPRAITPVLIPLERGLTFEELVDPAAAVSFDLDGTGPRNWGWVTPRAGWLVYRRSSPGIRSGLQLLGSVSWWVFWRDGYEAMSALDDDGDGWLAGPELEGLAVWNDADQDGISREAELFNLDQLGVAALSCQAQIHPQGFPYSPAGIRYQDGTLGDSYDWMPSGR
jgi:tetratricopeptide (TPR) repeat protein